MSMRVATFGQTSTVLQNAMKTQARLAEKQIQESTGLISTDYGGLGSSAGAVASLEVSAARTEASISTAEQALSRIEMIYDALGSMSDLMTDLRAQLSAASVNTDDTLQATAEAMLEELTSLLNTQYEGRYLFAGGETETKPVDLSGLTTTGLTTEDTNYYQGDDYVQSVRLSSDRSLDYGITADNTAFETAIRTLSYLASATDLTSEDLAAASELLVDAQDQILALQSVAGIKASTLETYISDQEDYLATVTDLATTLASVDIAVVAVEAANYKTQLEASYSALGTMTSLSVLDYLR
ncbi:flagellin [Roseibium suaedae]|uniref:Flagellar hook-associated protein 3 FlgL n=1 Tax=Roseibium suaedae TaxID=735517 RepID=A0A1M7IBF6_9HYPH|nr:flagellin [Roseibium suaedae]SHM38121.1 flagellar hook-associated protein 3 FlgL [Roseibium suaedae]